MTTATYVLTPSPTRTAQTPATDREGSLLVCASSGPSGEPQVVLADGSYETAAERVFWRRTPGDEVLRVPLRAHVAVRPVRRFSGARPALLGEQRLLDALTQHRSAPAPVAVTEAVTESVTEHEDPLHARLTAALAEGDVSTATCVAGYLWRHEGLAATHAALANCLATAASRRAPAAGGVLAERTSAATVQSVLERLRALTPEQPSPAARTGGRPVVLVVPPGDPHTMALTALAHLLQEAGETVLVVEDAPVKELAALVSQRQPLAVVVSAHLPWPVTRARAFLGALRAANPDTLLAVGGPGAPPAPPRADLVTNDPQELLKALRTRRGGLTQREREVLLAVAEGRTTNEIADALGLAPATVKTHLDNIFTKTGTEHRAAAVARALRQGWIS